MTTTQKFDRQGERGNVLFLILIAVALFAALSYAVTQSTRSGSGDTSSEKNKIGSAQLAQYPAGVRTSVVRMVLGGVPVDGLLFDGPSDFATGVYNGANKADYYRYNVFHPTGGGAIFQNAASDLLVPEANSETATGTDAKYKGAWVFSSAYQINGIGMTDSTDPLANDIIAFLPGLTQSICRKLNDELGISDPASSDKIPENFGGSLSAVPYMADAMRAVTPGAQGIRSGGAIGTIGGTTADANSVLRGQPFGCTRIGTAGGSWATTKYVYYHVLVER